MMVANYLRSASLGYVVNQLLTLLLRLRLH